MARFDQRPDPVPFGIMNEAMNFDQLRLIEELRAGVGREEERRSGGENWSVAFSPDNTYFAWSCGHSTVTLLPWHALRNRPIDPAFSRGQNAEENNNPYPIVINCGDIVWSMSFGLSENDQDQDQDKGENKRVRRHYYNFSPPTGDTLILAVGLNNGRIKIFSIAGKLVTELIDHQDVVRDLKFSPDGRLVLLSASRDSTLKLWDLKDDGNMFKTLKHSDNNEWVMCCAWSPDSKWAASGGSGREVCVWQTKTWTLYRKLSAHLHNVASCQFSPGGAILASCSFDTTVILWDYVKGRMMSVLRHLVPPPRPIFASGANEHYVRHLSFSPDGVHVGTVCDDGNVRIWNIYNVAAPVCSTEVQNALCLAYSNDGFCLAVGTREGTAHLFAAPMLVQSLSRLCRSSIRRLVASNEIDLLPIPGALKLFLAYEDVFLGWKLSSG